MIESQLQCNFNVKFLSFNKIEQKQGYVCFDVLNAVKLSLFNDEVSKFVMYILTMLDFFCCVSACPSVYICEVMHMSVVYIYICCIRAYVFLFICPVVLNHKSHLKELQ